MRLAAIFAVSLVRQLFGSWLGVLWSVLGLSFWFWLFVR